MFTLGDVLTSTNGRLLGGRAAVVFSGIANDTRTLEPGELFVAFRGEQVDGHAFVSEAFARGAAGALIDDLQIDSPWAAAGWSEAPVVVVPNTGLALAALARFWRSRHSVRVIGVTGSVGKTTAKEAAAGLLSQRFTVLRSLANYNTDIGLAISLMRLEPEHEVAVLEMAMHDLGEIRRLAEVALPEVGIVTNVLPTHLERLGTIERIAEAKRELIEALPAHGTALLNADDERVRAMAPSCAGSVVLYGTSNAAELRAGDVLSLGLRGVECTISYRSTRRRARLHLLGRHAIYPALSSVGAALHLGLSFDEAVDALEQVEHGPRLTLVHGRGGSTIIDDSYNASPASTVAALDLLEQLSGRRIAVLGDMLELGAYEEEGHRMVGARVPRAADWLLTIGPRARMIASEARAAGMSADKIEWFEAPAALLARLETALLPGDSILVKASHGMRLDALVEALRAPQEMPSPVVPVTSSAQE